MSGEPEDVTKKKKALVGGSLRAAVTGFRCKRRKRLQFFFFEVASLSFLFF